MKQRESYIGERFGRWVVLDEKLASRYKHRIVLARCDCGTVRDVSVHSLIRGLSKSCGCLSDEAKSKRSLIHGESWHTKRTPEYRSWEAMKARCFNQKNNRWHCYGGRGITVCPEWRESYQTFLRDMGRRPSPRHSIDRIDNDGNYEPGNCRWATPGEQRCNKQPPSQWRQHEVAL